MAKTRDAIKIIDKITSSDPEAETLVEEALINGQVAQLIYSARTKAGLTHKELAELVGTKQAVITSLEDADYQGHTLSMLEKIAHALNQRVMIELVPLKTIL